jgi:hypothetical protein
VILPQPEFWARGAAAEDYIGRLQSTIIQSRASLPAITQSAERAAGEFLSGGNLWVAGRQADFIAEVCQRTGGLMLPHRSRSQKGFGRNRGMDRSGWIKIASDQDPDCFGCGQRWIRLPGVSF